MFADKLFCIFFPLCQAQPWPAVTPISTEKSHHERENNPPAFGSACRTCLDSGLDPEMVFPGAAGTGEAVARGWGRRFPQGGWRGATPGAERWPGTAAQPSPYPARAAARGLPYPGNGPGCALTRAPDKRPESRTIKPRFLASWTGAAVKLALWKLCRALRGAWLGFALVKAFS